ncbi:hypothetical protein EJ06DRAFT_26352 [Trichodelitschia bisporula]|uniref:Uncharacterized protein n=1 Tax=Trichodelitschia bisporula TaxID=703511 RepID=A0A6G1IBS7_9PEZI|nr:hypothetical protein EJ06DRAFT_26352 [Trichodelitschia bisporula]
MRHEEYEDKMVRTRWFLFAFLVVQRVVHWALGFCMFAVRGLVIFRKGWHLGRERVGKYIGSFGSLCAVLRVVAVEDSPFAAFRVFARCSRLAFIYLSSWVRVLAVIHSSIIDRCLSAHSTCCPCARFKILCGDWGSRGAEQWGWRPRGRRCRGWCYAAFLSSVSRPPSNIEVP